MWFKDVIDGYDYLVDQGYEEIAVAGLSLAWCIRIEIELKSSCKGYYNYVCTAEGKTQGAIYELLEYAKLQKYEGKRSSND